MGKFTINGDFNVHLTIDLLFDTVEQPPTIQDDPRWTTFSQLNSMVIGHLVGGFKHGFYFP